MIDALSAMTGQPWLILPDSLEQMMAIADRMGDPQALAMREGKDLKGTDRVQMRDGGVAVISITGPIFRYANLFTAVSGATSTQLLATDFTAALNDSRVSAIVFDINSPGGNAAGINELGQAVFEARGRKPVLSYAGATMASAAYWIGAAADQIIVDQTAIVGSIGVVTEVQAQESEKGRKTYTIVSKASPKKVLDPSTDEGRAEYQGIVDDLAAVFVQTVARNRCVTTDKVLSDFGQGGVKVGRAAVDSGLADRFGSLEATIQMAADQAYQRARLHFIF